MKFERPWGNYEILLEEENYVVKRIEVNSYQKFSLQYHDERDEYWTIVGGFGKIVVDGSEYNTDSKTSFYIPKKSIHRSSAGQDGLTLIEVQIGNCSEEDIVRLQDDYGRV
jgi:mannose-6-phosphate isomerase-like protein (cupin superfamily)